ncbi:MAG: hypothetical protein WB443_04625 [Nitrososphaeraceae archaeon]
MFFRQSEKDATIRLVREIMQNGVKVRLLIQTGKKIKTMLNEIILTYPYLDIRKFDEIL